MMRNLTDRQIKIMKHLINHKEYISIESISSLVVASKRTIRRDIGMINDKLSTEGIFLASKAGRGVIAEFRNDAAEITSKNVFMNDSDVFNRNVRLLKIASDLLMNSPQPTSISELSKKYFISRASIVNDLKKIEIWLIHFDLALFKDLSGTRIIGNEKSMRIAMKSLVLKSIYSNMNMMESRIDTAILSELSEKFGEQHVLFTTELIIAIENKLEYGISDPYYINLFTHILVLIHRINLRINDNEIPCYDFIAQDRGMYEISLSIINTIEKKYTIQLNKIEAEYIYQYLVSSGKTDIDNNSNVKTNGAGRSLDFTRQLIVRVSSLINVDITMDNHLMTSLLSHVKPMLNRLEYHIRIKNPLLHDIKNELGSIFAAVKNAANGIAAEQTIGPINDDEIGYLTVHIQAAIENNIERKRVLLVCSSGLGTSQLLYGRVIRAFPCWEIVGIVPGQEIARYITQHDVDIIISTIRLAEINRPVVYVSALFTAKDIARVTECLVANYMK